jgi:hypothetical protein
MSQRLEAALSDRLGVARDDFATIVTHLFLVAGIVFFDWNVGELVLVYLVDVAVALVVFGGVALTAAQPVEGHDDEKWQREPEPVQVAPFLPPIYRRNVRPVANEMLNGTVFFAVIAAMVLSVLRPDPSSLLSAALGLTVLAICVSHLVRAWRQFVADGAYRERSPADAIRVGLRPVGRLVLLALLVVVPVTAVLALTLIFVFEVDAASALPYGETLVLLSYVVPIGAASVWLRNDRFGVGLQYDD